MSYRSDERRVVSFFDLHSKTDKLPFKEHSSDHSLVFIMNWLELEANVQHRFIYQGSLEGAARNGKAQTLQTSGENVLEYYAPSIPHTATTRHSVLSRIFQRFGKPASAPC